MPYRLSGRRTHVSAGPRTGHSGERNCVGNRNIGGERVNDRAILLYRQAHGTLSLGRVQPSPTHTVVQVNGGIAARLLFAAAPCYVDPEIPKLDPHLFEDHNHVRAAAGAGRQEEREHRTGGGCVVSIDTADRTFGGTANKTQPLLPADR